MVQTFNVRRWWPWWCTSAVSFWRLPRSSSCDWLRALSTKRLLELRKVLTANCIFCFYLHKRRSLSCIFNSVQSFSSVSPTGHVYTNISRNILYLVQKNRPCPLPGGRDELVLKYTVVLIALMADTFCFID